MSSIFFNFNLIPAERVLAPPTPPLVLVQMRFCLSLFRDVPKGDYPPPPPLPWTGVCRVCVLYLFRNVKMWHAKVWLEVLIAPKTKYTTLGPKF